MTRLKIEIIRLGSSKHKDTWKFIHRLHKNSRSKIFEIVSVKEISLPDADGYDWSYSDNLLSTLMKQPSDADIRLAFIDYPLEDNYFVRRLDKDTAVMTFYQAVDILKGGNVSLNNYALVSIYIACTTFYQLEANRTVSVRSLFHDETRGCLFDMTGIKEDILLSVSEPQICYECESSMKKLLIDMDYLSVLKRELRKIKKPLYYKITDFVKKASNPILIHHYTRFTTN